MKLMTIDVTPSFHAIFIFSSRGFDVQLLQIWCMQGNCFDTNRRFRSMGHLKIVGMFLKTMLNSWNDNYFLHDHGYWRQKV